MAKILGKTHNPYVPDAYTHSLTLSEKYAYKSVKTALLLSNVIAADHQNSCLFTNKGHFSSPLWVLSGILAKFHE